MKKCARCNQSKALTEFDKITKSEDVIKHCKKCVSEMEKEYIRNNTDKNGNYIHKSYSNQNKKK